MKRYLYITLIALVCCFSVGCSTTHKAAQTSTEQHITSSTNKDSHTEKQTGEAVNVNQSMNSLTNAVIEFTKTEYYDGTIKVDTTGFRNDCDAIRPRDRESKEPPNVGGVKSVTTGRITLNNERNESTETDIKRDSETKTDESISENKSEDNAADTKTEEKPKRGFIYYLSVIVCAVISIVAIIFIAYGIRRIRDKK